MKIFAIVLRIVLAASVAHSLETAPLLPTTTTWSTLFFHPIQFTRNLLVMKLDSMRGVKSDDVDDYLSQISATLEKSWSIIEDIRYTIEEKTSELNASLGADEKRNERSREIFQEWVRMGNRLESKYINCTTEYNFTISQCEENIFATENIFDEIDSYLAEMENCTNIEGSWIASFWCITKAEVKIGIAYRTIRSKISRYEESLKDLKMLNDKVEKADDCINHRKAVPAELLEFRIRALSIINEAKAAGIELPNQV